MKESAPKEFRECEIKLSFIYSNFYILNRTITD